MRAAMLSNIAAFFTLYTHGILPRALAAPALTLTGDARWKPVFVVLVITSSLSSSGLWSLVWAEYMG